MVPWPTEPGLRVVGDPSPDSPVVVTGNYDLTVRRLLRALEGSDAWVVVAPSRRINVWCAAAGGLLSSADIITALTTSGLADRVRHRRAILPQLAATGVEAKEVSRRSGWKVRFGPVYAEDLKAYFAAGMRKHEAMMHVRFGWTERCEMAVAWAAPISLVVAMVMLAVSREWVLPSVALAWLLALGVFCAYDRLPRWRRPLGAAVSVAVGAVGATILGGAATVVAYASVIGLLLFSLLTFDFDGSTPVEGGSFFDSREWRISLDRELCKGVYSCWAVCPEGVFAKQEESRKVEIAGDHRCIKCGACVVQCPEDALFFTNADGARIPPENIRRYKLNMLGRRGVDLVDPGRLSG